MSNFSNKHLLDMITVENRDDIKQTLEIHGVCIIPGVLSEETCDIVFDEMVKDFVFRTSELTVPFDPDDENTWSVLKLFHPLHNMLYKHWGLSQSQYLWDHVRSDPDIIDCFSKVWDTEELICSFDGISFHLPGELCGEDFFQKKHWYHFDQSYNDTQFKSVQGLVNMFDTNEGDATLTAFLKSHQYFDEYGREMIAAFERENPSLPEKKIEEKFKLNFNRTDNLDYFRSRGCHEVRIECPKGSLVLFDSRTLHQGSQPLKDRPEPNIRCVSYVCMTPIDKIREYAYSKKVFINRSLKAVEELRTTSHWPQYRKLETKLPSSRYGPKVEDPGFIYPDPPTLNERSFKLVTGIYDDRELSLIN